MLCTITNELTDLLRVCVRTCVLIAKVTLRWEACKRGMDGDPVTCSDAEIQVSHEPFEMAPAYHLDRPVPRPSNHCLWNTARLLTSHSLGASGSELHHEPSTTSIGGNS